MDVNDVVVFDAADVQVEERTGNPSVAELVLDADLLLAPRASQVAAVDGPVPDARLGALVAARCPRPRCPDR